MQELNQRRDTWVHLGLLWCFGRLGHHAKYARFSQRREETTQVGKAGKAGLQFSKHVLIRGSLDRSSMEYIECHRILWNAGMVECLVTCYK